MLKYINLINLISLQKEQELYDKMRDARGSEVLSQDKITSFRKQITKKLRDLGVDEKSLSGKSFF